MARGNHAISPSVWLVFDKKSSGKRDLVYAEAVSFSCMS
jgi:hypothetical protein